MKIDVKGVVVSNDDKWIYDLFEIDSVCPRDVLSKIESAKGEELEIEISSGGGDLYAGLDIYTALKGYKGDSVSKIMSIAASAASLIAMGTKKTVMSPPGQLMIHNVSTIAMGDHRDLEHEANVLKGHDAGIANAYMLKTGMSQNELLELMANETYLNAQEALKFKFVDEIMFDEEKKLVASIKSPMIPIEILNKMRNIKAGKQGGIPNKPELIALLETNPIEVKNEEVEDPAEPIVHTEPILDPPEPDENEQQKEKALALLALECEL